MSEKHPTRSSQRRNPTTVATRGSAATVTHYLTPLPVFSTEPTVRCLSFGPDRVDRWGNGYFFCTKCQYAQEKMQNHKKKKWPNLDGKRYKCEAKHQSLNQPQAVGEWQPSRSLSSKGPKKRTISQKSSSPPLPDPSSPEDGAVEAEEDATVLPPEVEPPMIPPAPLNQFPQVQEEILRNNVHQLQLQLSYFENELVSERQKNASLLDRLSAMEQSARLKDSESLTLQQYANIGDEKLRSLEQTIESLKHEK